jgi:purine catabolism regulator
MADPTRPCLCLADLLGHEAFGLELVSGGAGAERREVRGAHSVEVDAPARWLANDWIMLTTGVRLHGDVEAQRALVPQLEAGGASALGFGVGLGFKRVPPALVDVAQEHEFPVFVVPYDTPFREIIRFIDSTLAGSEEPLFRRLTALQRYLVDALRTPEPERTMVDRLARFLDASVLLVSAQGTLDCSAGKAPVEALIGEVCAHAPGPVELEVADWHALATPILLAQPDQAVRWLVLASTRPGFVNKLAKTAAEATAPLLAAMARLSDVVRDQEQAVRAALLEEALEPVEARDPLPLAARAAAFGLDFSCPARLAVIRGHAGRREVVAELERARLPHLAYPRGDALIVLVQGGDRDVRDALAAVAAASPDAAIGVGRAVAAIAEAHHSLRDAELAVDRRERRIMYFDDFDLGTFMVSEIASDRLAPKVDEILSVLRGNVPVHEALSAYFAHDLDIAATAAALHMHRNSLRYRLARAEQLLGRSLKQPSTIAAVYLALVADGAEHREPVPSGGG